MDKALAKLTRENHFNNLIDNLPLFTILYGAQCAMAYFIFYNIVDPGRFAVILGISIISIMSAIYVYDKYNHVLVYKNKIQIFFEVFGTSKVIHFDDILDFQAPSFECEFGPVTIVLKNKSVIHLQFIDYPVQVKKVLQEYLHQHNDQEVDKAA
ncbi:MAG: hypothetical protein CME62_04120 [Halobacteriovoraceae bacterium]|nr:hypothetical protein [Halobacteriovoraceae bacterium]